MAHTTTRSGLCHHPPTATPSASGYHTGTHYDTGFGVPTHCSPRICHACPRLPANMPSTCLACLPATITCALPAIPAMPPCLPPAPFFFCRHHYLTAPVTPPRHHLHRTTPPTALPTSSAAYIASHPSHSRRLPCLARTPRDAHFWFCTMRCSCVCCDMLPFSYRQHLGGFSFVAFSSLPDYMAGAWASSRFLRSCCALDYRGTMAGDVLSACVAARQRWRNMRRDAQRTAYAAMTRGDA